MRDNMLPYGRQSIDEADIQAVVEVLQSDWLTTGPTVEAFEEAFATQTGCAHAVALSNGTAALHAAMFALGIGPGDEVIVPAMTFVATANCVAYQGGKPVFADVLPASLLIDPDSVAQHITPRTRAIIAVDYAGQPCDYDRLRRLSDQHGLALAADACHAVGGSYKGRSVGSLADLSTFSFHPVKHMTTGEGGAVTTDQPELARRMRLFRNHGITSDHRQRAGAQVFELLNGRVQRGGRAPADGDRRPRLGQPARDLQPDAGTATGHQRDAAVQLELLEHAHARGLAARSSQRRSVEPPPCHGVTMTLMHRSLRVWANSIAACTSSSA